MPASTLPKAEGKVVRRSDLLSANSLRASASDDDESDYLDSDEPRKKRRVRQDSAAEDDSSNESDDSDASDASDAEDQDEDEEEDEDNKKTQKPIKAAPVSSTFSAPSRVRSRVAVDDKTSAAQQNAIDEAVKAIAADNDDGTAPEDPAAAAAANVLAAPTDPNTTFDAIDVKPWLVRSLSNMAIRRPTAIQKGCIPAILNGHDCIGGSRTGSGKTVAFAVPILQAWSADPSAIFALVLTPTRELALQIYEQFMAISAPQPLKALLVTGGADMRPQAIALAKNPHIVIATPGRLADHIRTSGEDTIGGLKRVRYVVLDEADRLLTAATTLPDNGNGGGKKNRKKDKSGNASGSMLPDVETCLGALPPPAKRQTLLFTATVTPEVRALKTMPRSADRLPVFVCEVETHAPAIPATLTQTHLTVPVTHREHYLHAFLSTAHNAALPAIIVFVNRTSTAAYLHHLLRLLGHRVTALHAALPQRQRTDNLGRFRAAAARILVATDVAARGLDIPEVALVVNYDVPRLADDYIHRVGRTARAGRTGEAVTFVGQRDVDLVLSIEARVGRPLESWSEEGVNLETRVTKEALKLVGEKKREALLEIEENREVGGKRKRGMQKLRAT